MDNLHGDIFRKILLLLPVKSLLRSKLVCKTWRSHISNPEFVKQHIVITTNNPNNDLFIVHEDGHKLSVIDVNFLDRAVRLNLPIHGSYSYVIASCNGLLCINCGVKGRQVLYLWNPVTRQVKEIHRYTYTNTVGENDVNYFITAFGFGFDHATSDYKAVMIKQGSDNAKGLTSRVDVYSLNENCWKEINVDFEIGYIESCHDIPTANGSHYWLARNKHDCGVAVLSFNMQSQKFSTIQLPDDLSPLWDTEFDEVYWPCMEVAVFQFKDSVAIRYRSDIYTLDDGNRWSKKLSIKSLSSSVECLKTGEFIGCQSHYNQKGLYSHEELFLYDSVNDVVKPVQPISCCKGLYHYTESLLDLN